MIFFSFAIISSFHGSNMRNSYIHHFILIFPGYITNQFNDQLPVGLLAQFVECCTDITEFTHWVLISENLNSFLFATAEVVSLTAMMFFAVIFFIPRFQYMKSIYSLFHEFYEFLAFFILFNILIRYFAALGYLLTA